ncbi:uncharacterized protein LOC121422610 [Lytechinus variegatus]|uniref:uncharacterized protein LOC121422610 n=1 Tax=Lytechinus variegatus TaxID=7654 RepID=UPI001BB12854|nr:uncharacterized protein LOC121422610 [Lytechinus variegatus]
MFRQQSRAEIASSLPLSDITQKVCTRSATPIPSQQAEPVCFFCNKPGGNEELHHASTMDIDKNVRRCATELGDTKLHVIAKLCAGDMAAIKAKYHRNCLRSLYNRIRTIAPKDDDADQLHGIAFAELVVFMEERHADEDIAQFLNSQTWLISTRLDWSSLITVDVANGLCQRFEIEQVVCPPKLRHRLFTTGAVDNVDHNPSSAMARDSFHGTGISLIQHPSHTNEGQQRGVVVIGQNVSPNKSVVPLPSEYTSVPPVAIRKQHFTAPAVEGPAKPPHLLAAEAAVREEYLWLRLVTETLQKKSINDWVSWSAYHADMQQALLGDWLEDSGWKNALTQANIANYASFIWASHVTKTLHTLLQQAYTSDCTEDDGSNSQPAWPDDEGFHMWCKRRAQSSVHFDYWLKTLSLEILLLVYIRSLREGNFDLYVQSLTQLMPWIFALHVDHTNYARCLSVHIRDMMNLADKHPDVLAEFRSGKFVVHKTRNNFSAMAIDQYHEQNNALVKGCGGAIGLTGNPGALRRWMVAGPEIARMTAEFEVQTEREHRGASNRRHRHHDQTPGVQVSFMKEVRALTKVFQEMGNPFLEETQDLMVLDTGDIMETTVTETVRKVESLGEEQYAKFVEERLELCTRPVTEPLKKNRLLLFSRPEPKTRSKQQMELTAVKNDCSLFSRLYISCQSREGDLNKFFCHENQAAPPALSAEGKLHLGTKADLLQCLKANQPETTSAPKVDVIIIDGAAVVQMLNPTSAKTFKEYSSAVFGAYISDQLERVDRLDIVWDVYIADSLKGTTREKRGKGIRKRVHSSTIMPKKWKDFLRVGKNKRELFSLLSHDAISIPRADG